MEREELRAASLADWERSAPGWEANVDRVDGHAAGVTERMLAATAPAAGERVLELACGAAGPGLAAAAMVGDSGTAILSDFSPEMLAVARRRADGAPNVELRVLDAEAIDLADGSVDVVLCRFGLMLMPDPAAALSEMRRVCGAGGRVAVAVWGPDRANPWAALPMGTLMEQLGAPPPDPSLPGMFALGDRDRLAALLGEAGFEAVEVDEVAGAQAHPSFDAWWDETCALTPAFGDLANALDDEGRERLRAAIAERAAELERPDGLVLPSLALVATGRR